MSHKKLVDIVQHANDGDWVTSLDAKKIITKENLVITSTKTTYDHLANRKSANDNTACKSSHIPDDKGKYDSSPVNDSSNQKHADIK